MEADILIKNGQIVNPEKTFDADLAIKHGKILAIIESLGADSIQAKEVIDAKGKYVLPGVIDPHVHLGFGAGHKEWETETRSAAIGGVTTIINYLTSSSSYEDVFFENKEAGEKTSYIDFAFHFTVMGDNHICGLEKYVNELGVTSFKLLMNIRGEEGAYLGVKGIDDGYMYDFFRNVARLKRCIVCLHAENIEIVWRLRKQIMETGRDDLLAWMECRPGFVEAESICRAAFFAKLTKCPIYIVHLSGKEGLKEIERSKYFLGDIPIHVETCPHYLTHTSNMDLGSVGKVNPPLRKMEDIEALWRGISTGLIDTFGSDHLARKKDSKIGSIWKASAGFPGIAMTLPVLLSEGVNKGRIPINKVVEITSYNVAKIFGCYPKKGSIQPGSDADLVLVDLNLEKEVTSADLESFAGWSLYEGWKLKGWPVITILRGNVVMKDGKVVSEKGYGKFIKRGL
jgi:dihydropyrimidinase